MIFINFWIIVVVCSLLKKEFFIQKGDKAFRAQQVYEWLWMKAAKSFDQMTNISLETREMLKQHFVINHIKVDTM